MVDASSSGRVAPKIKSIDVRANLLSQRLAERSKLFQVTRSRIWVIAATLVAGGLLLPWLYGLQAKAAKASAAAVAERTKLQNVLTDLQAKADEVEPKMRREEMVRKCQARASAFLNEYMIVMNAVSPQLALNNLKGEVVGGEVTLSARADAETFAAVEAYVLKAANGAGKNAGITTTKRSDSLRKGGISFEFTKKVVVGG